ncbi:hypothetical protein K8T06_13460 [bacterium]|nr:hypothetical protein [bacterium]
MCGCICCHGDSRNLLVVLGASPGKACPCQLGRYGPYEITFSNDYGKTWIIWDDDINSGGVLGNIWFETRFTPQGEAFFYLAVKVYDEDSGFRNQAGEPWREVCRIDEEGYQYTITAFAVSPDGTMIFGSMRTEGGTGLCLSSDDGQTWQNTNFNEPGVHPQYGIETIVFHPTNPDVLFLIILELFNAYDCYIKKFITVKFTMILNQ